MTHSRDPIRYTHNVIAHCLRCGEFAILETRKHFHRENRKYLGSFPVRAEEIFARDNDAKERGRYHEFQI